MNAHQKPWFHFSCFAKKTAVFSFGLETITGLIFIINIVKK